MSISLGRATLPSEQVDTLHRAVRVQWVTIAFLVVGIALVGSVLGNSQAMKAAWVEDLLSLAPPIAFLVAIRISRRRPTAERPYGFHRSVGVAHLVAAVALVTMGGYMVIDSGLALIKAEHPPIGSVELFGQLIWLGWLMIGAMVLTGIPPIVLGRIKMGLAEDLHDKVLYADAKMNKADWMTAAGTIIGVTGIGLGLWWADAAAALFISGSIMWDGITNTRAAVTGLMDARATTFDDERPHPLIDKINDVLRRLEWVQDAGSRVRDEGHVFHVEAFVVPRAGVDPTMERLVHAESAVKDLDWKLQDVVVVPLRSVPEEAELSGS
jgi:cation diffusion facilitator family transporter